MNTLLNLLKTYVLEKFNNFKESGSDLGCLTSHLRENISPAMTDEGVKLLLSIPTMMTELSDLASCSSLQPTLRVLVGGIYSYVFNPLDYIDDSYGFLGLIDDALIILYGMRFIEENYEDVHFKATQDLSLSKAVEQYENILNEDLIRVLKRHSYQLYKVVAETNFAA